MPLDNPLYDDPELASAYAEVTRENLHNARYERPAVRELLDGVHGLDVLDAGCAAGEHALWLAEHGAHVTAIDVSAPMTELARRRLGARGTALCADLAAPLPFADASFDCILSSMALHYLASWETPLREFRRTLRAGGRLIVSTHHPQLTTNERDPYHEVHLVREAWSGFGSSAVPVQFYHRPMQRIVDDIVAAGFELRRFIEPPLAPGTRPFFLIIEAR